MLELNKVQIIGNLTRDPEPMPKGGGAKFGIAVSESWKDKQSGDWKQNTAFLDVEVWKGVADFALQYLAKGARVYIEGALKFDAWEDHKTGERRNKLSVVGHRIQFTESKSKQNGGGGGNENPPAPKKQFDAFDEHEQGNDANELPL